MPSVSWGNLSRSYLYFTSLLIESSMIITALYFYSEYNLSRSYTLLQQSFNLSSSLVTSWDSSELTRMKWRLPFFYFTYWEYLMKSALSSWWFYMRPILGFVSFSNLSLHNNISESYFAKLSIASFSYV